MSEAPRKVSPEAVEVIGQSGEILQEASIDSDRSNARQSPFGGQFGQFKVVQAKPWMMVLGLIFLPVILIGLLLLAFLASLFGRSVFRVLRKR